ncbi:MAG: hypothetical protein JWN37_768 [Candidatus Nomurabacteria bacterium]|nr:hypothetical protein [Candidatus Nomurabacteria bacterium]
MDARGLAGAELRALRRVAGRVARIATVDAERGVLAGTHLRIGAAVVAHAAARARHRMICRGIRCTELLADRFQFHRSSFRCLEGVLEDCCCGTSTLRTAIVLPLHRS